jgi:hypothetical protein
MPFTPYGSLGYEAVNSYLCCCLHCGVGDFMASSKGCDTLHTNGSVEGVFAEIINTDALE